MTGCAMERKRLNLPRIRMRQEEIDSIVFMLCCTTRFKNILTAMEKRFRTIPNGWRDMRMIQSVFDRLVDNVLDTVPTDKLITLQTLIKDTRVHITYSRQIGKMQDAVTGIHEKDLDLLTAVAHDGVCKLCDGNCDMCDIGKVFDKFLYTEREKGESYTFIDLGKDFNVPGIKKGK